MTNINARLKLNHRGSSLDSNQNKHYSFLVHQLSLREFSKFLVALVSKVNHFIFDPLNYITFIIQEHFQIHLLQKLVKLIVMVPYSVQNFHLLNLLFQL